MRSGVPDLIRWWLIGFVGGVASVLVTVFLFPIGIAIFLVVSLVPPRAARAGGACVTWGAAFFLVIRRAADDCAALNRQPNASCTMGDNTPFFVVGLAVLAVGVGLTGYAIATASRPRGRRSP